MRAHRKAIRDVPHRSWRAWLFVAIFSPVWPVMPADTTNLSTPFPPAQLEPADSGSGGAPSNQKPDMDIAAGTILPIRLNSLSSAKNKIGDPVKAKLMQDVPLENGSRLRAGCSVLGRVIDPNPARSGSKAVLAIEFDAVRCGKQRFSVHTHLRAIASTLEVESAQTPTIGPGESDVYDWLATTQIGGEVVYGKGGEVFNGDRVVGRSVYDGILAPANSREGSTCRGAIEGNDRPQAFWVFSSDACGVYGFPYLTIGHAGRTDPQGQIVLVSERGPVKIRSGSGMLLRVQP